MFALLSCDVASPASPVDSPPDAPPVPGLVLGPRPPLVVSTAPDEPPASVSSPPASPRPPPPDPEEEARRAREREREAFERAWPLHGVCYHYLAHIRARPDASSPIVGYMRRGAQFRAKGAVRGPGCPRGWHEVVGGGFVCRGEGYQLGETPQTFDGSPVAPALDSALPYAYAFVARPDAPQFWRPPTPAEAAEATSLMDQLRASRARAIEAAMGSNRGAAPERPRDGADDGEGPDPGLEAPPQAQVDPPAPTSLPPYFRMRMERGFWVSVDREEVIDGTRWFRTIRGAYVPADAMAVPTPPLMRGVVLGEAWRLPIGFVYRRGVQSMVRDPASGALRPGRALEYHTPLLLQEEVIERRGTRHRVTRDGLVVRETAIRLVEPLPRPRGIRADERWIHVDLSSQTLVAYEGDRPVFATLVSSGRAGFETPTGTFRIQSKHVSATMDDTESATEPYSIEDVPWTMYFEGSFALHAALWHDQFGRVRSHGCVNLAPADARWLFQWTSPSLPPGWHGVVAGPRRLGTWVHVTD